MHKCRYADNIGDPRGFKIHLMKNGLKKGILQSIRGNRLNLFLQQCEVHHRHKAVFNKYLHSNCPKNIDNLHRVQHDYNMAVTCDQLQSAGIISQLLSRLWMLRFYRNANRSFTFVEALKQVYIFCNNIFIMGSHRHKPLYTHYPVSVSVREN